MDLEWQSENYPRDGFGGEIEGEDIPEYKGTPRQTLRNRLMIQKQPWKVTDVADAQDVAGIASETANQKAKALQRLGFKLERAFCSQLKAQSGDRVTTPDRSRGIFSYLNPDQSGDELPLPPDFTLDPAMQYTGALSGFDEAQMKTLMRLSSQARRSKFPLDFFCGTILKGVIDEWGIYQTGVTATKSALRQFTQSAASKQLINCVDSLSFSYGDVRIHLNHYLACDIATGADTEFTYRSGFALDLRMWAARKLKDIVAKENEDQGGGPRGFYRWTGLGLRCGNPLGQWSVLTDTD